MLPYPNEGTGGYPITWRELVMMIEGVELTRLRSRKRYDISLKNKRKQHSDFFVKSSVFRTFDVWKTSIRQTLISPFLEHRLAALTAERDRFRAEAICLSEELQGLQTLSERLSSGRTIFEAWWRRCSVSYASFAGCCSAASRSVSFLRIRPNSNWTSKAPLNCSKNVSMPPSRSPPRYPAINRRHAPRNPQRIVSGVSFRSI